jgi:hypothetical protein
MQATADSSTESVNEIGVARMFCSNPSLERAFPNKVISRWPAIKLAVNRTHKVIGRIMFLVSSIITMNDMSTAGVPWGSRWESMWLVFFIHPNSIIPNQNVSDRGRVTVRWEVTENTCGYKARKFISKIDRNAVIIISSVPFSLLFKVKLTSFLKFLRIARTVCLIGFLITHHFFLIIRGRMKIKVHAVEKIEELGSNTENKFVIILLSFLLS